MIVVAAIAIVVVWRLPRADEIKLPRSENSRDTSAGATPPGGGVGSTSGAPMQPEVVRPVAMILRELRDSYDAVNSVAARVRLQGELTPRWESAPPSASEVLAEIGRRDAPPDYRVYLAQTFRNLAKLRRVDAGRIAEVAAGLVRILSDDSEPAVLRGRLAVVLAAIDQGSPAVQSMGRLLTQPADDAAMLAVTALRHAATDEAAELLHGYLRANPRERQTKPRTTGAALVALTGYGKLEVTPIAVALLMETQSPELIQATLASAGKLPTSLVLIQALVELHAQPERVPAIPPELLRAGVERALKPHATFVRSAPAVSGMDESLMERARAILERNSSRP